MRGGRFIVTVKYCAGGGGGAGAGPVAGYCRNLPANLTSFFPPAMRVGSCTRSDRRRSANCDANPAHKL